MANGPGVTEAFIRAVAEGRSGRTGQPPQTGGAVEAFTRAAAEAGARPQRSDQHRQFFRDQTTRGQRALEMARQFSGRVIDSAFLSPIQAVAELPGVLGVDDTPADMLAERVEGFREGISNRMERRAFEMGLSEREAAAAGFGGELFGFMVPAVGALKVASLLRRSRRILPFDPLQDVTAGLMFGGLLTPNEEATERAKTALIEGGLFGAVGIVARGVIVPIMRYRAGRVAAREADERVMEIISRLGGDEPPILDSPDLARGVLKQLSEEDWILNSPIAQRILERNANETAVVQAIMDNAQQRANIGVLRNITDPARVIRRIEDEFPAFRGKMQAFRADNPSRPDRFRGKEGTYDLYFGTSGLSGKQRSQLAREGFFEGQRVLYTRGGIEGEYIGRAGKTRIAFRDLQTGKIRRVNMDNIQDLPYAIVPDERAPELSALYKDFSEFYSSAAARLRSEGSGMSPDDFIRGIREGRIDPTTLPEDRAFFLRRVDVADDAPGAAAFAVVGRDGQEVAHVVGEVTGDAFRVVNIQAASDEVAQGLLGPGNVRLLGRQLVEQLRATGHNPRVITGIRESGAAPGRVQSLDVEQLMREAPTERFMNEPNAITHLHDAGLTPQDATEALAVANARRAEAGLPPIPTVQELIQRSGVEFVKPNPSQALGSFDEIFEAWARERGFLLDQLEEITDMTAHAAAMIPGRRFTSIASWDRGSVRSATPTGQGSELATSVRVQRTVSEPRDLEAARVHFAERLRADLLKRVPEEDLTVFTRIRDQLMEIGEEIPDDLRALAARAGFNQSKRPDGSVTVRDINTGARFDFVSEREAREGLENVIRNMRDTPDGSIIPANFGGGITTNPGLLRNVDGELLDPNLGLAQQAREGVSGRAVTNMRDFIVNIDRDFGTPLFTRFVDKLIRGHALSVQESAPWLRQVGNLFKGWKQNDLNQLGRFLTTTEEVALNQNRLLTRAEKIQIGRELGIENPARFAAKSEEMTRVWRAAARHYGFPEDRIIPEYFGRIRSFADKHGGRAHLSAIFPEGVPDHWQWAAEFMRTGEMSNFELNPAIVMAKWFRGAATNRHTREPWEELARVVGTRNNPGMTIGDLSPAQREAMLQRTPALRNLEPAELMREPVLPGPIADTLREFLTMMRGLPSSSQAATRRSFKSFFKNLGVTFDETLLDEYVNVGLSTMYGSAMGLRIMQTARNLTQPAYLTGGRLGFRDAQTSMRQALTIEGFREVQQEGVIRAVSGGGLPMHDQVFEQLGTNIQGSGIFGTAIAGAMRSGLRLGNVSRKVSEKFLIPYTATDELNRAWSYFWYKDHTRRLLQRFEGGQLTPERFLDDLAPGMARNLKEEALRVRQREGNERFLRTVARWGTDEDAFIYGASVQPAWMQHPAGRFMGMFGTWPLWLKSHYGRVMKNMTPGQQASYAMRTAATTGSLVITGYSMGVNMTNWIAPLSLFGYGGGPGTEWAIDAQRLITAPMDQKADAARNLQRNMGALSLPGQVFFRETVRSTQQAENFPHAVLLMGLGRPMDEDHWYFDTVLNQRPIDRIKDSPTIRRWFDNEDGFFESEPPPISPERTMPPGLPILPQGGQQDPGQPSSPSEPGPLP